MSPYDFAKLREHPDKEALCHAVFNEAHSKWTFQGLHSINDSQITVLCTETFLGEVCNGGIDQYLFNEAGRYASLGPKALRKVGLAEYAVILEEALQRCTNDREENRFGIVEDFFEPPSGKKVMTTARSAIWTLVSLTCWIKICTDNGSFNSSSKTNQISSKL